MCYRRYTFRIYGYLFFCVASYANQAVPYELVIPSFIRLVRYQNIRAGWGKRINNVYRYIRPFLQFK